MFVVYLFKSNILGSYRGHSITVKRVIENSRLIPNCLNTFSSILFVA